jgi:hypothetical protein
MILHHVGMVVLVDGVHGLAGHGADHQPFILRQVVGAGTVIVPDGGRQNQRV